MVALFGLPRPRLIGGVGVGVGIGVGVGVGVAVTSLVCCIGSSTEGC